MRLILALFFAVFLTVQLNAQSLIVNEYFNATSGGDEWVELVTTQDLNLQGWGFRDFSGSGDPQSTTFFTDRKSTRLNSSHP